MTEATRRAWLITIGGAAASMACPQDSGAEPSTAVSLPAGVYLPSTDHLGHALMSSGQFHVAPPGCPTDYVTPSVGIYRPLFFSSSDFATIQMFVRAILGDFEADGIESSLETAQWVDLRVYSSSQVQAARQRLQPRHQLIVDAYYAGSHHAHSDIDSVSICREGLIWLAHHQFSSFSQAAQLDLIRSISDDVSVRAAQNAGSTLFVFLKTETIKSFYTSARGLKELEFKGNAFYARSPGCRSRG